MIVSEKEAGHLVCPKMSGIHRNANGLLGFEPVCCMGSSCMVWDWVDPEYPCYRISYSSIRDAGKIEQACAEKMEENPGQVWKESPDNSEFIIRVDKAAKDERRGTCGLITKECESYCGCNG